LCGNWSIISASAHFVSSEFPVALPTLRNSRRHAGARASNRDCERRNPIVDLSHREGLLPLYRWMLALSSSAAPGFYKSYLVWRGRFCRCGQPVRLRPLILKMLLLRPCDEESLRDSAAFEAVFESQRRAWRGSVRRK
jgi:hypothetical protein